MLKAIALSDSHNLHHLLDLDLDGVDLIVHAGDFSRRKEPTLNHNEELAFLDWYGKLPVKYKVLIPGNHETAWAAGMIGNIEDYWDVITLNHETKIVGGIEIFGSPITPSFGSGWAYNVPPNKIKNYWDEIPKTTQLLVTHGPPFRILDATPNYGVDYKSCGCTELLKRVKKVKPDVMIFGHIHEDGGRQMKIQGLDTNFINAAVVDENYKMKFNKGVHFEI